MKDFHFAEVKIEPATDIMFYSEVGKKFTLKREDYCKKKGKCEVTDPLVCINVCKYYKRQNVPKLIKK